MKKATAIAFAIICVFSLSHVSGQIDPKSPYFDNAAKIAWDRNGNPRYIKFKRNTDLRDVSDLSTYLRVADAIDFEQISQNIDRIGITHTRYIQKYEGVEIFGAEFILHSKGALALSANGKLHPVPQVEARPSISEKEALGIATSSLKAKSYMWESPKMERLLKEEQRDESATYFPQGKLYFTSRRYDKREPLRLVYRFEIYTKEPIGRHVVDVSAHNGGVINSYDRLHHITTTEVSGISLYDGEVDLSTDFDGENYWLVDSTRGQGIFTYDLENGVDYESAVLFSEADDYFDEDNNKAGVSAHFGAAVTYDYFLANFGLNSFDGSGAAINSYVHYGINYFNAFWDGFRMTYGDGDGVTTNAVVSLDIVGHEIAHAVTEHSADLVYAYEPGALNESFSDIFGQAIEFETFPATASWNLGDQVFTDGVSMIRSMSDPNSQGSPDTYLGDLWHTESWDNGGVHFNSGVQNFWFYLLVEGGAGVNDKGYVYDVPSIGIDAAQQIAYRNLTVYLTSTSDYPDARYGGEQSAIDLFGEGSSEHLAVTEAWKAVGVPPNIPILEIENLVVDFVEVPIGYQEEMEIVINNVGAGILEIYDISSDIPTVEVSETSLIIDDLSSSVLTIYFTPDELAQHAGNLSITSNAGDFTLDVIGIGVEPPVAVIDPESISVSLENESHEITLSITNAGLSLLKGEVQIAKEAPVALADKNDLEDRRGEPESRQLLREREVIYHKEKLSAVNLSLSGTIYWEDVESGENGWTTEAYSGEDLWHTQDRNYSSPFNSWWCGVEGLGDYKDVGRVNTAAVSPEINLTSVTGESLYLNFDESYWTESGYDFCMVDISTDGGATWVPLRGTAGEADAPSGSSQGWIRSSLDISAYIGESIHIRFYFDTGDQHQNWYSGWYFDNIQIATYPGSPGEWLRISTSNFQVNPDQSLDIEVTVDATTLNSGTYESAIIIYSNDPQATSIGVPVELDVMGAPKIQLATTAVNYESYYVGYAIEKTVEVRNVGSASLNIIDIASDVSEFYTNQNSSLLEPQQTMELSIFYQPDMVGLDEGTLTLYSDDPVSPQVTIALEGEGIEPPVIELSAAYLEQSLMAGESAIQNLTLGNTGANELEWELILTTSGTQSFDRDRSEDVMSTTFAPEEHGTLPSFAAVADVLEADLDAVPFYESFENGNYDGWEDGPDKAVREVTNETAAVGEYSFHYQNSEPASDHYRGVHKRFKSGSQPYHVSFYVKSASKLSNDGYFVLVDSEGYIVAFFYMRSNGKIYMNDVVTGDNTIPYNENQWYRIDLKDIDWNDKDFDFYVDHQLIKADIPFRRSEASDIAQAFMYNLDPSEAWWDDIRLGDSFSWISLDPTNGIVSSASSEQVEVGFDASELYGGSYEASLLVRNNDPGNQEIFVPISLNVAGIPDIQAPSTLTFEDAYIGYETTKVVEIQNTGTDMLAVSDIQFDEESYSVNISSFALAPEGTREVEITYHPTAMETDLATLTITSDDPDEETLLIELSGNGIHPPQLTLNPTSMSESLPIGGQSIRVLTIGNNQGLDEVRWELKTNYHPATESESMALFDAMEVHDILVNDKNSLKGAPSRAQAPERMQGQYLNGLPQYTTGSVADGDTLYLIDDWGLFTKYHIPSQTVAESIQLPYSVYGLALLDGTFWMSDLFTREVYGFDTNGNFVGFFSAPESGPKVIARDGEYLLITKASGWNAFDIGSFYRMDTEGNVLEIVDNPGLYLDGMTYTLGRLWGVLGNNNTFAYLYDFSVVDGEIQVNDFIYHNKTDDDFHFNLTSLDQKSIASIGFYGTLMEIHVPSWVGFEESSGVVAAGESQELNIAFDATNMVGGNYNAELTIVSNDPANPEWIVPMSLEVIGEPEIAIRTDVLDFGETYIGAAEIQSIWVINEGDGILSVSANLEANDHFDLEESNFQVPAFDSIEVSVVYAPQEVQDDQVILFISSNDTDEMESEVLLSGEGKEPPIIAVQPSEIIEALLTGESSIKTVTIDNTQGQDALSWALFSRENVEMDSPVTGNNYDYLWLDSDSVSSLYEWEEISDTGSSIIADIADESVSGPYPIGFDFPFYGNYYSVFYISSNGFITFNPNSDPGCCVGQPLPNEDNIDNLIAFAWENGYPRGDVFYDNQQDKTIIQFSDYGTYGSQFEGDITVQVIIYRDGQIKINYQSVSGYYLGNLLSVGIENEFGTEGVQVSLWESYIHNELSILFMPSPSWIEAEQYQGIIPAGESQALTIELDAADLAVGLYEASLLTLSNDPLDPIVEIPVELLVSNDVIIELTPDSYSVSQEIGETSFQVLTNLDQFEVSTTDEWLTVNQNGSIVSLEYQENESASNRIGEITISGGNTQAIFTLTQFGATPYLAVNPATVSVDFNAGTVAFDVTTNHEAYLISYEENGWCMVEDDGLGSITVNFLENESISERKMTITIEAGELLSELTLTQSGRALSIDESLGSYIYPNPSKGVFIIEGAKSEDVQIIDVTGKKVPFSQKMIDGKLYIDVGSRGNIYFVKYNHQVAKVIISK